MKKLYTHLEDLLLVYGFCLERLDLTHLKRDYWNNPVKRGKLPLREDLEYMYIELNLPLVFVQEYFKVSSTTIKTWCKKLGIREKTKQEAYENTKKFNIHKYGVENTSNLSIVKEKYKNTCLEKYGVDSASELPRN